MTKKEFITKDGKVTEALMGGMFKVQLDEDENEEEILATLSGKIRKFRIRILPGDKVTLQFSPYDLNRGRIVHRKK